MLLTFHFFFPQLRNKNLRPWNGRILGWRNSFSPQHWYGHHFLMSLLWRGIWWKVDVTLIGSFVDSWTYLTQLASCLNRRNRVAHKQKGSFWIFWYLISEKFIWKGIIEKQRNERQTMKMFVWNEQNSSTSMVVILFKWATIQEQIYSHSANQMIELHIMEFSITFIQMTFLVAAHYILSL